MQRGGGYAAGAAPHTLLRGVSPHTPHPLADTVFFWRKRPAECPSPNPLPGGEGAMLRGLRPAPLLWGCAPYPASWGCRPASPF